MVRSPWIQVSMFMANNTKYEMKIGNNNSKQFFMKNILIGSTL